MKNLYLLLLLCLTINVFGQHNDSIFITGDFPDIKGARFSIYKLHIDTPIVNGRLNIAINFSEKGELYTGISYPWPGNDSIIYRDKDDGIVKSKKVKYKHIIFFSKKIFINPTQAKNYHIEFERKPSINMIKNFSETDYYKTDLFRLKVTSKSMDSKVYEKYDSLYKDYMGQTFFYILDSLYRSSKIPDKIYNDFHKQAMTINQSKNYPDFLKNVLAVVKNNLSNPVSPFLILTFGKDDILANLGTIKNLLKGFNGRAVKSNNFKLAKLKVDAAAIDLSSGNQFPVLSGKNPLLKNVSYNLQHSQHQYTLIEFWASWCAPCRKSNSEWNALLNTFDNKRFRIIGFSLDNDLNNWREAIKKDNLDKWLHISDLGDGFNGAHAIKLGIEFIPLNFLVDNKGKIVDKNISPEALRIFLEKNLSSQK